MDFPGINDKEIDWPAGSLEMQYFFKVSKAWRGGRD